MKFLAAIFLLTLFGFETLAQQHLEVEGKAKITEMDTVTSDVSNVVRLADGTLAIRRYKIGDFAQGGIIFWLDPTGEHGLVCAKQDQATDLRWLAGTYGRTRAAGDGIYAGKMNTAISISSHVAIGDDGDNYSARSCADLQITEGGIPYGDWYLPSRGELLIAYANKSAIDGTAIANGGSAFTNNGYWTSTEFDSFEAYYVAFNSGDTGRALKMQSLPVRAIRSF